MNRSAIHAATALLMATTGISFGASAADGNPLDAERWKTRPLVVVAPRADDPMLAGVRDALSTSAMRDAFLDREMVLYTVVAGEARRNDQPLPPAQAAALLAALSLTADGPATAVLVGKDGGAKLRQQGRVDFGEILPTIDAMPMRRR
jgi:hypothetical protein